MQSTKARTNATLAHGDLVQKFKRLLLLQQKYGKDGEETRELNELERLLEPHRVDFWEDHRAHSTAGSIEIKCMHNGKAESRQKAAVTLPEPGDPRWLQAMKSTAEFDGQPKGGVRARRPGIMPFLEPHELKSSGPILTGGITVRQLIDAEFEEPEWILTGIVPVGLGALVGRPKVGKSRMAMHFSVETSRPSGDFLGKPVGDQKVLYLALEDSPRRVQKRLKALDVSKECDLEVHTEWPTGKHGMKRLREAKEAGFSLIIVDTVSVLLGGKDQMKNGQMNVVFHKLQKLALGDDNPICILLIDHTPKHATVDTNPVDAIWGATSKGASVDFALGLYRERGKKSHVLRVQGRELADQTIHVSFEPETGKVFLVDSNGKRSITSVQQQILQVLKNFDGASNQEVANALGKDRANIYRQLTELVQKGRVSKDDSRKPFIYAVKH